MNQELELSVTKEQIESLLGSANDSNNLYQLIISSSDSTSYVKIIFNNNLYSHNQEN
jgi:hypothetical protein